MNGHWSSSGLIRSGALRCLHRNPSVRFQVHSLESRLFRYSVSAQSPTVRSELASVRLVVRLPQGRGVSASHDSLKEEELVRFGVQTVTGALRCLHRNPSVWFTHLWCSSVLASQPPLAPRCLHRNRHVFWSYGSFAAVMVSALCGEFGLTW